MVKLSQCIEDYLKFIRHEKGLATSTCEHYTSWLRHFSAWLTENGYSQTPDAREVLTLPVLRRYVYCKSEAGNRPRTIRSAFHPVRGLCSYLVDAGVLPDNPTNKITLPKLDAAIRHTLTDADICALFAACQRLRPARYEALCNAVFSALAYAALRRQELCDLKLTDVDFENGSVLVRSGKGSKSRKVYVCKDAQDALRDWVAVRGTCKQDWLFMLDKARRVSHGTLHSIFENLKVVAGMRDNPAVAPHSVRHWAATNFLRNGANIRDVQVYLGHSNLTTTSRYLHTDEDRLRNLAELTSLRVPPTQIHKPVEQTKRRQFRRTAL